MSYTDSYNMIHEDESDKQFLRQMMDYEKRLDDYQLGAEERIRLDKEFRKFLLNRKEKYKYSNSSTPQLEMSQQQLISKRSSNLKEKKNQLKQERNEINTTISGLRNNIKMQKKKLTKVNNKYKTIKNKLREKQGLSQCYRRYP